MVLQIINHAGHHIYADRPELFNDIVSCTCDMVDQPNAIMRPLRQSRIRQCRNGVVADLNEAPPTDLNETPPTVSDVPVTSAS